MKEELQQLLCPPGNGVFTVSTAKEKKHALHQTLYQSTDTKIVDKLFAEHLSQLTNIASDKVALLGVCSDNGGGILRGANWGPLFLREALYKTSQASCLTELGDVRVIPHLLHDKYLNQQTISTCQKALYQVENNLPVSPLTITEYLLDACYKDIENFRLLALGGDHSVSYPLVKTYLQAKLKAGKKVALIHFDAHTDLLRERLGIDLCFGSWLTHVLPFLDKPSHAIQLGIRASGKGKDYWQSEFGIQQYWASDIKDTGIQAVMTEILAYLSKEAIDEIYISFDIDALDASIAGATGTPEHGGLSLDDALYAISALCQQLPISGADLVEVAPFLSQPTLGTQAQTIDAATKVISAMLTGMLKSS